MTRPQCFSAGRGLHRGRSADVQTSHRLHLQIDLGDVEQLLDVTTSPHGNHSYSYFGIFSSTSYSHNNVYRALGIYTVL